MIILGTNFFGHDSAIFKIDTNNKEIFAISTERLTRIKHDDIDISEIFETYNFEKIDFIAQGYENYYHTELYEQDINNLYLIRILRKIINPRYRHDLNLSASSLRKKVIESIFSKPFLFLDFYKIKFRIKIKKILKKLFKVPIRLDKKSVKIFIRNILKKNNINSEIDFYNHHLCHVVSAYYFSPFAFEDEAICFSIDGYGDLKFSSTYKFYGNNFKSINNSMAKFFEYKKTTHVCSVGFIYSNFTQALGFTLNSDEGKTEALAPYAEEGKTEALAAYGKVDQKLYEEMIKMNHIDSDGIHFIVENTKKFYDQEYLEKLVGEIGRENFAHTLQKWLEDTIVKYLNIIHQEHKCDNLCLSGGVAANVILNLKIYQKTKFKKIYIFPAMGDEGVSAGAAILKAIELNQDISWLKNHHMPYFGSRISEEEIILACKNNKQITYSKLGSEWTKLAAKSLFNNKIVAVVNGRMEFGPRALGNRSILANTRDPKTRDTLNQKVKKRPWFQPFCPSILEEDRETLFENSFSHKHMATAFIMKKKYQNIFPSAVHVDGTSRPQFVERSDNLDFYNLLKEFKKLNQFGIIINTSFNLHGRTIVNTAERAIQDFLDCNIDELYMESYLIKRSN